jgi:DTW domain-containing protein YfiP
LYLGGKSESSDRQGLPGVPLEGIVVLDGTWAQAKTMWWRNPWLLKLKRLVLNPSRRSLYGRLRKEPRRECLSTIESVAEALQTLGEDASVSDALRNHFAELLRKYQARRTVNLPPEA